MRDDASLRPSRRRPAVLLVVLALIAGAAALGWTRADSSHQSTAAAVVVPATTSSDGSAVNPLTDLDAGGAELALVVTAQLDADVVRATVVAAGGDQGHLAEVGRVADAQPGAVIRFSVRGSSAAGAQQAARVLLVQASDQLAAVQSEANVPVGTRARLIELSPASAAVPVGRPQLRSAGIFGGSAAGAALVLLAVSGWLARGRSTPLVHPAAGAAAPTDHLAALSAGSVGRTPADDEGRFTQPSDHLAVVDAVPGALRRQELLREMVREDWLRSGSNVPWTRSEQRVAYDRAEQRLVDRERRRHDLEIEHVSGLDDPHGFRHLG